MSLALVGAAAALLVVGLAADRPAPWLLASIVAGIASAVALAGARRTTNSD